jgi:EAL domain-containing protein (putative c-di-GMP-specific phosphodiesterase class I)
MSAKSAQTSLKAAPATAAPIAEASGEARAPLCYVVDGDGGIGHFLSLILHGAGIDTEEFPDGNALRMATEKRHPDLVFLDVPLQSSEATASVVALSAAGFRGRVQLMSNRGSAVLAHVKGIGEQHHLQMLPVLRKPFETSVVLKILEEHRLGHPPAVAGRLDLDEALKNDWIEFWYQPKIDLRKKQLIGVEAFARARHPQHGVLMPSAFMPGAQEASLIALSEKALEHALQAGLKFSKLGVGLQMAVNISLNALVKLKVPDIVQTYRSQYEKWPGLIIDIMEEQIVTELSLAAELTKQFSPLNVKLAIDHFGRGYSSLVGLKDLPFAELKLDRMFVADCGTDKINAPLCKTVIDLAHSFGSVAVAIGIEKASDALALVSMGCDYGQGFLLGQPMPEERFISLLRQRTMQGRQDNGTSRIVEKQTA